MKVDIKKHLTLPNIFIFGVVVYFIIYSERKMYINTGPDPATIQWEKDFSEMKLEVEALKKADSIHVTNTLNYVKTIIENNNAVDGYSIEQLDSAFAALTAGQN